jgi:hypothetical protein
MENYSYISGNADAKGEARSDDETVTPEHGKTPAVTEISVCTESELPQTATAGMRIASTFCNVVSRVWQSAPSVRLRQEAKG